MNFSSSQFGKCPGGNFRHVYRRMLPCCQEGNPTFNAENEF